MKEKYTVNLDENNYILSVAHTDADDIELDLDKIIPGYLNCYRLMEGQLVLDEEKMKAEEEERKKRDLEPTWQEMIESQLFYTAIMTETLIGE